MIYLWHLFINWSVDYSISNLICDIIITSVMFICIFWYLRFTWSIYKIKREKDNEGI